MHIHKIVTKVWNTHSILQTKWIHILHGGKECFIYLLDIVYLPSGSIVYKERQHLVRRMKLKDVCK